MGKFVLIDAAGQVVAQVHTREGKLPSDDGSNPDGLREIAVERFGEAFERFDGASWCVDPERAADLVDVDHRLRHGGHAIAIAHATKAIEARLMLAGVQVDGLVAAEARATDQEPAVLALIIAAKAAAADQQEIERIAAKHAARTQRSE